VQMGFWFFLVVAAFFYIWIAGGWLPEIPPSVLTLMGIASGTALGASVIDASKRSAASDPVQATAVPNRSWYEDLLWDADGLSFHRLQMAVWTLVLGIVFIERFVITLALPDFDGTLLALMGISSGTYLGFKLPEVQPSSK